MKGEEEGRKKKRKRRRKRNTSLCPGIETMDQEPSALCIGPLRPAVEAKDRRRTNLNIPSQMESFFDRCRQLKHFVRADARHLV